MLRVRANTALARSKACDVIWRAALFGVRCGMVLLHWAGTHSAPKVPLNASEEQRFLCVSLLGHVGYGHGNLSLPLSVGPPVVLRANGV